MTWELCFFKLKVFAFYQKRQLIYHRIAKILQFCVIYKLFKLVNYPSKYCELNMVKFFKTMNAWPFWKAFLCQLPVIFCKLKIFPIYLCACIIWKYIVCTINLENKPSPIWTQKICHLYRLINTTLKLRSHVILIIQRAWHIFVVHIDRVVFLMYQCLW